MKTRPFTYLAWTVAIGLVLLLGVAACAAFVDRLDVLFMERGPLENMSVALWLLSAFAAAAAYRHWTGQTDRRVSFWIASLSCLAALRETDAHLLLSPVYLGRFGVRFRIDWVLNPHISIVPKLAFLALVILIVAAIFGTPLSLRDRFWKLVRGGDAGVGMLCVAVAGLAMGVCMDDLLRGTPLMTRDVRQLIEETGEFTGALAFFAASLLFWRLPLTRRLDAVGKPNSAK